MIEIITENFAGIDCLMAFPAGQHHDALPTVIFSHGFTSSKEVYAYFGVALAQAGFRAVLPDADMHGARYNGDAQYRLSHFWEILRSNIDEIPRLEAALREQDLIDGPRVAIAGASMGGMTALGALAQNPHFICGACMMGSGYFSSLCHTLFPPLVVKTSAQKKEFALRTAPLADYDPSSRLASIADRPLLLWHGEEDDVVPVAESARLEKALREAYPDTPLTYITEKGVGHRITPPALQAMVAFFRSHLNGGSSSVITPDNR